MPNSPPSVRDRLEVTLARLADRATTERVFLKLYPDLARAQADAADGRAAAGLSRGPLDGAIVSIKDVFDLEGDVTTAGSAIRRNAAPAAKTATALQRLIDAGAVIIGKTNLNEFCFTSNGINRHFGTPGNARDAARIPGGSSSGAGVSAAEGTCDIAIGTDTGGSVRIPAALNGVVGFKPTAGRVPLDGVFPLSKTLNSVGPLARTVALCADADAMMAGNRPSELEAVPLQGLRIGLPHGVLFREMDYEVEAAFSHSVDTLAAAGAEIVSVNIDDLLEQMRDLTRSASIASIEAAAVHADWLTGDTSQVEPRVSGPLSRRLNFPQAEYLHMLHSRSELAVAMRDRMAEFDLLALPTVPIVAPLIAPLAADDELADRTDGLLLRNPQVANQFDLTAISLPMPTSGLPCGLMLVARKGEDRRLLATAASVERALGRA